MRNLTKLQKPAVLEANELAWLQAVIENPSQTNKTRYRHEEIKTRLIEETGEKCVYCESKMRHVTPSHIEHKVPASKDESLRFEWNNLTIACPECNRRKGDFYDEHDSFIDPYNDDVETRVTHRGPIVGWAPGDVSAELSVKFLGLDGYERAEIVLMKVEKINEIDDLVERFHEHKGKALGPIIKKRLAAKSDIKAEYSAMVRSLFTQAGLNELLD
jgi:hypothetical protein